MSLNAVSHLRSNAARTAATHPGCLILRGGRRQVGEQHICGNSGPGAGFLGIQPQAWIPAMYASAATANHQHNPLDNHPPAHSSPAHPSPSPRMDASSSCLSQACWPPATSARLSSSNTASCRNS